MTDAAQTWFADATDGLLSLVGGIGPDDWDAPGLSDWTVRELVAHLRRVDALGRVPRRTAAGGVRRRDGGVLLRPRAGGAGIHAGVLARGREDAAALGSDPAAAVRGSASEALALVASTPSDRIVPTRICPLLLAASGREPLPTGFTLLG